MIRLFLLTAVILLEVRMTWSPPLAEIEARLRSLTQAIYEAYTSDDEKHVDYKIIGASEEFIRCLFMVLPYVFW